jgi:hypothetical protein
MIVFGPDLPTLALFDAVSNQLALTRLAGTC